MKKIAILIVLAVLFLALAKESLAYWKPVAGIIIEDPAPVPFENINY